MDHIDVGIYKIGYQQCAVSDGCLHPQNPMDAKFSLPYTGACALLYGTVDDSSFTPDKVADSLLQSLLAKVHAVEDPELTALYPAHWSCKVDLVLMDVCTHGTKDGIDAAALLRKRFPDLKIIVVTSMVEESYIKRARQAGADSFWYKEISPEDLLTVMEATMQGKKMWPDAPPAVKIGITTSRDLTETEIKILRLVCEGLEYSEIAERLNYTKDNVKYHIRNILQKTGYTNKTQLAIAVTGKRFIIPKLFDEQDDSDKNPIVL